MMGTTGRLAAAAALRSGSGRWAIAALVGLVLLLSVGGTTAQSAPAPWTGVEAIYQSNNTTEQSGFTVSLELANPSDVSMAYFTFCQLTNSLCYAPVLMTAHGASWFAGTTGPMTSYNGMTVGVRAGYNITIDYANGTNVTEPTVPNSFTNLTIATTVIGEFMFEMTVVNPVFALTGVVSSATTHGGLAGAEVTLSPGSGTSAVTNASGAYSFPGLANGTYSVAVTASGYQSSSTTVTIAGQNTVKDFSLTNGTTLPTPVGTQTAGGGFLGTAAGISVVAIVVAVVVVVAIGLLVSSRRKANQAKTPATVPATTDAPPQGPAN
jgi:hypothetical protein